MHAIMICLVPQRPTTCAAGAAFKGDALEHPPPLAHNARSGRIVALDAAAYLAWRALVCAATQPLWCLPLAVPQTLLACVAASEAMTTDRAIAKRLRGIHIIFRPGRVVW